MPRPLKAIEAEALELSENDKLMLIQALAQDLQTGEAGIEKSWLEEIDRRLTDLDAGRMQTFAYDDVMADLRAGRDGNR